MARHKEPVTLGTGEFDRAELKRALVQLNRVVSSRPGIPALGGVLLEVDPGQQMRGGTATLTATDLELTVRAHVRTGPGTEAWSALIPARMLKEIVGRSKAPTVSIFCWDGKVKVDDVAEIRTLPAEDFPKAELEGNQSGAAFEAGELAEAVTRVAPFASRDEARPILTGILAEVDVGSLTLTATDSYRLASTEVMAAGVPAKGLIPARALEFFARIGKGSASTATLEIGETRAVLQAAEWTMATRLIEGEFPNYRQLIPEPAEALTYDLAEMEAAIDQASTFCRDSNPIRLELNGVVEMSADSPDLGAFRAILERARWAGEDRSVAYNPDYFGSCVQASGGAPVEIRDGLKPAVFRNGRTVALVMPVRPPAPSV